MSSARSIFGALRSQSRSMPTYGGQARYMPRAVAAAAVAAVVTATTVSACDRGSEAPAALADRVPASPATSPGYTDVARQTRYGDPLSDQAVTIVSRVRDAAVAGDVDALVQLCAPCTDPAVARQLRTTLAGEATEELARVLLTHAETTDGLTYPGLSFGGASTDLDRADQAFLASTPVTVTTTFEYQDDQGQELRWQGASRR